MHFKVSRRQSHIKGDVKYYTLYYWDETSNIDLWKNILN